MLNWKQDKPIYYERTLYNCHERMKPLFSLIQGSRFRINYLVSMGALTLKESKPGLILSQKKTVI